MVVVVASFAQEAPANLTTPRSTNRPAIPAVFDKEGRIQPEGYWFTTEAYEKEAFRLVVEEANRVAKDLGLPEKLPISRSDLSRVFVLGYGQSVAHEGAVGNVHTRDYGYFVSRDQKLCFVEGAHQDQDCQKWVAEYQWPRSQMDTNGAYQLATQWLAAARMDVKALNRDCTVVAEPEGFYNQYLSSTQVFVPIYDVYWQSAKNKTEGYGSVASVKLFAPTKTLVSLRVEEPKYILRKPLVFTNLDVLLAKPDEK